MGYLVYLETTDTLAELREFLDKLHCEVEILAEINTVGCSESYISIKPTERRPG